jgi:hypothetical protein
MMFLPYPIYEECMYFKNVLSEKDKLVDLIEELNLDKYSTEKISQWQRLTNDIMFKKIKSLNFKDSQDVDKKNRYLINSFKYAFLFCMNEYKKIYNQVISDINDIYIYKSNAVSEGNLNQEFNINNNEKNISMYLFINSENSGMPFYIDKQKDIYIWPEPGSLVIVPDKFSHSELINKDKKLYFAKSKFQKDQNLIRCSNLI